MDMNATNEIVKMEKSIEYVPFGAEDKIKLSLSIVRNMVATPTKQGDLPGDRDCMRFLMLCQAGRLNPFAGDCYLLGYRNRDNVVEWSMITSISAFRKRAESHEDYDGEESGCIVVDQTGVLRDRVGDFVLPTDQLVGGWARVHFKSRKHPMERRVQLAVYQKGFGVWKFDAPGMICKVAEAHALRDSFPTMLGDMRIDGEVGEAKGSNGNGKASVARLDDLNAAVIAHPTAEGQVIDTSTSNVADEPDASGADVESPGADVSTHEAWREAMEGIYAGDGEPTAFAAMMKAVAMAHPVTLNSPKGQRAREETYKAALGGRLDRETGKIV